MFSLLGLEMLDPMENRDWNELANLSLTLCSCSRDSSCLLATSLRCTVDRHFYRLG